MISQGTTILHVLHKDHGLFSQKMVKNIGKNKIRTFMNACKTEPFMLLPFVCRSVRDREQYKNV